MIQYSKKASLNLSINAIVIIVLAMTLLGLGLGFIRTQIGQIGETTTQVQEQIKQQILDDLRTGNKKLSFPTDQLKIGTANEDVQAIGIKNTGDAPITIGIFFQVKADDAFKDFISAETLTFVKGTQTVKARVDWDDSPQSLGATESKVVPIAITAPDKNGNYLYKIILKEVDANGKAVSGRPEFDSKTFFIKTS